MEADMALVLAVAGMRVAVLAGERVAFRRLGDGAGGYATTLVAFGGAWVVLMIAAGAAGSLTMVPAALFPSLIYTLHFTLYTAAFAEGPVTAVSPWTNLPIVMLYAVNPRGGALAWGGIAALALGAWLGISGDRGRIRPLLLIIAADVLLVGARLLDASRVPPSPLGYAANLYGWVTLWLLLYGCASDRVGEAFRLVRGRPAWATLASVANGGSYLTLAFLVRRVPLPVVEALACLAALTAALAGAYWLNEPTTGRKMMASWLMSGGAVALICDHLVGFG